MARAREAFVRGNRLVHEQQNGPVRRDHPFQRRNGRGSREVQGQAAPKILYSTTTTEG